MPHDRLPLVLVDLAGDVFAIALEGGDDVELLVIDVARLDRAAIDHDRRAVEPAHGNQAAGHVLVATGERNVGVVPLGFHDRFDRVGDQVARLERIAHARGAHRDAVADADGVEAHADHAGGDDPFLHPLGEGVEVHVAGVAFVPDAGDADLRLLHVFVGHAGAIEHGLAGALALGLGDVAAVFIEDAVSVFGEHGWARLGWLAWTSNARAPGREMRETARYSPSAAGLQIDRREEAASSAGSRNIRGQRLQTAE